MADQNPWMAHFDKMVEENRKGKVAAQESSQAAQVALNAQAEEAQRKAREQAAQLEMLKSPFAGAGTGKGAGLAGASPITGGGSDLDAGYIRTNDGDQRVPAYTGDPNVWGSLLTSRGWDPKFGEFAKTAQQRADEATKYNRGQEEKELSLKGASLLDKQEYQRQKDLAGYRGDAMKYAEEVVKNAAMGAKPEEIEPMRQKAIKDYMTQVGVNPSGTPTRTLNTSGFLAGEKPVEKTKTVGSTSEQAAAAKSPLATQGAADAAKQKQSGPSTVSARASSNVDQIVQGRMPLYGINPQASGVINVNTGLLDAAKSAYNAGKEWISPMVGDIGTGFSNWGKEGYGVGSNSAKMQPGPGVSPPPAMSTPNPAEFQGYPGTSPLTSPTTAPTTNTGASPFTMPTQPQSGTNRGSMNLSFLNKKRPEGQFPFWA